MARSHRSPHRRSSFGQQLTMMLFAGTMLGLAVTDFPSSQPPPTSPADYGDAPAPRVEGGTHSARFTLCHSGGGTNCVVDGDTFRLAGERIRIADIDTPETHPPRCAEEAVLGRRATERLRALLNAGPVTLVEADRPTDRHGRRLAIVLRDGRSLGGTLIDEGLARPWEGYRRPWCGQS